eukprot:gene27124-biopygen17676
MNDITGTVVHRHQAAVDGCGVDMCFVAI